MSKSFKTCKSISILGTKYSVKFAKSGTNEKLEQGNLLGYTDPTTKEIVLLIPDDDVLSVSDLNWIRRKVFRHECIHAFMLESGLDSCNDWAGNEELVDWIARQFPKMMETFINVGIEY